VDKVLAQARRLDPCDQRRLFKRLRRELQLGDPLRLWDDWEDADIDAAYADDEA